MEIVDFSNCPYSNRHGTYGGAAGDKDGILYNSEYWIIKYPKPTAKFANNEKLDKYTTAPLSEFIGSHIFEILGYDVHHTLLGVRNGKIVVACKDFCESRGQLSEIRTIKNGAFKELSEILEKELHGSATGDNVDLDELFLHLDHNPLLKNNPDIKKRFWEQAIVDIFIDNNDRNNGNWGLLFHENGGYYTLAPIYDNGNSFMNKFSEDQIAMYLSSDLITIATGSRTAYQQKDHTLSAKKFLSIQDENLRKAILHVIPLIEGKMKEIENLFKSIPETYNGIPVMSKNRRECYLKCLRYRFTHLLLPVYEKAKEMEQQAHESNKTHSAPCASHTAIPLTSISDSDKKKPKTHTTKTH